MFWKRSHLSCGYFVLVLSYVVFILTAVYFLLDVFKYAHNSEIIPRGEEQTPVTFYGAGLVFSGFLVVTIEAYEMVKRYNKVVFGSSKDDDADGKAAWAGFIVGLLLLASVAMVYTDMSLEVGIGGVLLCSTLVAGVFFMQSWFPDAGLRFVRWVFRRYEPSRRYYPIKLQQASREHLRVQPKESDVRRVDRASSPASKSDDSGTEIIVVERVHCQPIHKRNTDRGLEYLWRKAQELEPVNATIAVRSRQEGADRESSNKPTATNLLESKVTPRRRRILERILASTQRKNYDPP